MRNLSTKPKMIERIFSNTLLELLLAQTKLDKFSIFSVHKLDLPLMLPYIVRMVTNLVSIRHKLHDKHHTRVNFSCEIPPSLLRMVEAYQIVKEGAAFSTKMRALRTDLILACSEPQKVRHIRHTYKSLGPLSRNKMFKKKLSTVGDNDTLVQVQTYSAPQLLSF